jgi:transglutaminase-like putative cysteine protease
MNDLIGKRDPWAFNWLILAGTATLLPHLLRLPIWVSLVFFACLAWRWLANQRTWYVPGTILRGLVTGLFCVAIFKEYGTLLGRDAGTSLVVGLAGLKFLELRTLRDYTVMTFIYLLLIGVNFLYEESLVHGLYLIAAVFMTMATLVRINLPGNEDWRASLRLTRNMMLMALPLMLVFYLFFPRIQGGLWGLPTDARAGLTGLSSEINPGSISQLAQSEAPAFRVEFEGELPANNQRYWRALVLWTQAGRNWKQGVMPYLDEKQLAGLSAAKGERTRYTVTAEPSNKPWMPALDVPVTTPQGGRLKTAYLIESRTPITSRTRYVVESTNTYPDLVLSAHERRLALQTNKVRSQRVLDLVHSWQKPGAEPVAIVNRALRYFNENNFRYTLKPPLLGNQPLDEFLFEARAGFCEHYATSFVYLMRLAGIPARIVLGYQGGEYNENGGYLIVRQSDAHAWAEVWLKDRGWTRVDPTAAIAPERVELGIDAIRRLEQRGLQPGALAGDSMKNIMALGFVENLVRRARLSWDTVNLAWFRWTTGYDLSTQMELLSRIGLEAPGWLGLIFGMAGGAGLFVVILMISLRRGERDVDPVQRIYKRFEQQIRGLGLVRLPHEGPIDFCRRIIEARPQLENQVRDITESYIHLRYNSEAPVVRGLQLEQLEKSVRAFKPTALLANTEA